jgi:hypothetical protein
MPALPKALRGLEAVMMFWRDVDGFPWRNVLEWSWTS